MNRDDVIRMAREASLGGNIHYGSLEHFAALVAASKEAEINKERQQYADWFNEAAADIADWGSYASEYLQNKHELDRNVQDFKNRAAAIRARSNNA